MRRSVKKYITEDWTMRRAGGAGDSKRRFIQLARLTFIEINDGRLT